MALADIPGLGAYYQRRQMNEQQPLQELKQAGGVMGLLSNLQKQQQEQAFRSELSALGPDASQEQLARVAAKFGSPADVLRTQQSSLDRRAALGEQKLQRQEMLEFRYDNLFRMEQADRQRSADRALDRTVRDAAAQRADDTRRYLGGLMDAARREGIELRRDIGQQNIDLRREIAGLSDGQDIPAPSAPAATSVPADIDAPTATGGSGFFGGIANTIADMVGKGMPYPKTEQASQALTNLRVRTVTMAQDAIPGRPSNYLMQQLDKLAVQPNSLLMADQRAKVRFEQTREMLKQEAERMERDILKRPQSYTKAVLAKVRNSHSQIKQLVGEYDAVIQSFGKGPSVSGRIVQPPPGFTLD
jgi:hypothetical protein